MQNETNPTVGHESIRIHCHWNIAAWALAHRQTIESENQAAKILRQAGGYLDPLFGELFPFPAPAPSVEMLEKYPGLADMPRDSNAKLKLLHHRVKTYEDILAKLYAAGEIKFYDPRTLLMIGGADQVDSPLVYMDEIAAQIIEYSKTHRPHKKKVPKDEINQEWQEWIEKEATKLIDAKKRTLATKERLAGLLAKENGADPETIKRQTRKTW